MAMQRTNHHNNINRKVGFHNDNLKVKTMSPTFIIKSTISLQLTFLSNLKGLPTYLLICTILFYLFAIFYLSAEQEISLTGKNHKVCECMQQVE